MAILCNHEEIPINIDISVGDSIFKMLEFSPKPMLSIGKFEIRENVPLAIRIELETNVVRSEEVILEIENHSAEKKLIIKPYENLLVFEYGSGAFPFRLGYTNATLKYGGKVYTTQIPIIPIHYKLEQVKAIHQYLEERIRGICFDLANQNQMMEVMKTVSDNWYQDYSYYHMELESEILSALAKINDNYLKQPTKVILAQSVEKKINVASIRKSLTKPFFVNENKQHFNQKTILYINERVAGWLKYTLSMWYERLVLAIEKIELDLQYIQGKEIKIHERWNFNERIKGKYTNSRNIDKQYIWTIKEANKAINRKIQSLHKQRQVRKQWIESLEKIRRKILFVIMETDLKIIPLRPPKGSVLPGGQLLKRIKRIYDDSEKLSVKSGNSLRVNSITKPTWQVFEYFVLLTVIEILTYCDYDFTVVKGFDLDLLNNVLERGIPASSSFELENESHFIKIVYDDPIPFNETEAASIGHDFFCNSAHNRPDIRVELYKKTSDGLKKFLCNLLIDAKHRKLTDICGVSYPTETEGQLCEYKKITYRVQNIKENRYAINFAVNNIFCVFSGDAKDPIDEFKSGIYYFRISPRVDENGKIEKIIGIKELEEGINSWLKSYFE